MRIKLRYFLLACFLIGAVGLPLGWKWYQAKRDKEIERLEKELAELWPSAFPNDESFPMADRIEWDDLVAIVRREAQIRARLEKLTGRHSQPVDAPEPLPGISFGGWGVGPPGGSK